MRRSGPNVTDKLIGLGLGQSGGCLKYWLFLPCRKMIKITEKSAILFRLSNLGYILFDNIQDDMKRNVSFFMKYQGKSRIFCLQEQFLD